MSDYETYQLINGFNGNNGGYYTTTTASASGLEAASIWVLIAGILAIIGGILTYFLFVRSKTDPKSKFAKWLKDFLSFKIMWLEPILKVVYYIATIFVVLFSFSFLSLGGYGVLMFFLILVFGPILVRVAYEAAIMFVMIWRNTQDISTNTKKK